MNQELFDTEKSIVQDLDFSYAGNNYTFSIKRDDLIDNYVSGNKWRKLKYNIAQAIHQQKKGILTFGGAFSNHLVATAKASKYAGLKSIGIVRGDELNAESNPTLKSCANFGMDLIFISRESYKQRRSYEFVKTVQTKHPDFYVVPEGGANYYGMVGCVEIATELPSTFHHVFTAMGTGATAAGLRVGLPLKSHLHVVSALKGNKDQKSVEDFIQQFTNDKSATRDLMNPISFYQDQFGGYGKWNESLIDLLQSFYQQTQIKTDLVYTAKVIHKIIDLINKGVINEDERILMIHTGGVQGMDEALFLEQKGTS